ncbi:MAG: prepilin-type N-terminal cleavage/methylation domain-containing protein [bacterium]
MKAKHPRLHGGRDGATLVEVLIAVVILAVMAVGSAAYLHLSRSNLAVQRNKRTALEAGNARMEEMRTTSYTAMTGLLPLDYSLRYLRRTAGTWVASTTDPGETVNINGSILPITTTVRFVDIDGGPASYDCIAMVVKVAYRPNIADRIILESIYAR